MKSRVEARKWLTLFTGLTLTLANATAKEAGDRLDKKKQQRGGYGRLSADDDDALTQIVKCAQGHRDDAEEIASTLHNNSPSPH